MTREVAKHIVDVAFSVPQAVRRVGEDRTYQEDEIREAKNMAIKALEQEPKIKFTNSEWIDFLCEQFEISRTSAKELLHVMMSVKKEDNFKKQFSGRK